MDMKKGLTLLEVMIVVAIIGILAAIAIPSYLKYVKKARRAEAFNALMTIHAAQEMYKAEHGVYTDNWSKLSGCSPNMAKEYTIYLTLGEGNSTYFATAVPYGRQAGDYCFRISHNGSKECAIHSTGNCTDVQCCQSFQECSWETLR